MLFLSNRTLSAPPVEFFAVLFFDEGHEQRNPRQYSHLDSHQEMANVPHQPHYEAPPVRGLPYARSQPYIGQPPLGSPSMASLSSSALLQSPSNVALYPGPYVGAPTSQFFGPQYGQPPYMPQPPYVGTPGYGTTNTVYNVNPHVGTQLGQPPYLPASVGGAMPTRVPAQRQQQGNSNSGNNNKNNNNSTSKKANAPKTVTVQDQRYRKLPLPTGWSSAPFRPNKKEACCVIS